MGFCIFNNIAIGVAYAQTRYLLKKIAVIDFDVHHGNGTQHLLEHDPGMFYASSHQHPAYPGTGLSSETGVSGNVVNVPLPPGTGSSEFQKAYQNLIFPKLRIFNPELIIISAGFDGHIADPLAQLELQTEDYHWLTQNIAVIASELAEGRIVSILEGGYDLDALRSSTQRHVSALMEGG